MRRFWLYFLFANVIGGFFLWLTARELPFDDVEAYVESADLAHIATWCGLFLVVYSVCHLARVLRWYTLVEPLGEVDPRTVHKVCVVGLTAILLLPLRLGELVRPYLLARRTKLDMSPVLGTAVVERVVDGLVITGLLFLTLATYDGGEATAFARSAGALAALVFVPALIVVLAALWRREWTVDTVRRLAGIVSTGLGERLAELLDAFIEGFRGLVEGKALGRFGAWTVLYWFCNALSLWLLAHYGFELDVGLWDATAVLAVFVIGIMIPAGPAMAGNFEYFVLQGMALFVAMELDGVAARVGAFAATLHVLQFFVVALPGFLVMWADPEMRHLIRISERAADAEERP